MTSPRILTAREIARRAEHDAETMPPTVLRTHVPREAFEIGALPPRLSTFSPPLPSLSGLARDGSEPVRPAGRARSAGPRHRPGVEPPEGIVHFHPANPRDAAAFRRMTRELLHLRPGSGAHHRETAPEAAPATPTYRPSLEDCRGDLSEFRRAMADFTRARYFGGDDRHAVASAALQRAEAAYHRLYANLPLTPGMTGILENLDGRLATSRTELAAMAPRTGRSRRHA
ncbi:MAG TPA: hypothetical protein VJR29_08055 [bacterium]|nr:hypothetical protein [bacterium]